MSSTQKKKAIILTIIIGLISLLCVFFDFLHPAIINLLKDEFNIVSSKDNLMVHFIDVGEGDSIAINLPDGKVGVIDTGRSSAATTISNYISEKVLNGAFNKTIDYLILTHADADHIGGAMRLLADYNVNEIFMPTVAKDTATYLNLVKFIEDNDYTTHVNTDGYLIENDYTIEFFGPFGYLETNDDCPVIKLSYRERSFLFTGDVSSRVEADLIDNYAESLDIDVLKVAHHGSSTSSSLEFLFATTPNYAVISSGGEYGHPTDETLENLNIAGAEILRTDTVGNIMFVLGENYDLAYLTGEYTISALSLDYRYIIIVTDIVLMVNIVIVVLKKDNKKVHKH